MTMAEMIGNCRSLKMDIVNQYQHYEVLIAEIGFFSAALTLVATLAIILFIVYKGIYSNERVKPLLHLSIADFLLSYLWVSSSVTFLMSNRFGQKQRQTQMSCFLWQLATEVIHLVTFCFTVNYSINVYLLMREREQRVYIDYTQHVHDMNSPSARKLHLFKKSLYYVSWLLPVIIMLPIIVHVNIKHVSACQKCVILIDVPRLVNDVSLFIQAYGFIVLATTLLLSIVAILALYCLTLRLYWKAIPAYHTDRQRRQLSNMQKRISVYVIVFLLCWSPALIMSIIKSKETLGGYETQEKDLIDLFPLYVIQAVLTPLQGFFNTIVYGWSKRSFRQATRLSGTNDLYVPTPEFTAPYYEDNSPTIISDDDDTKETLFDPHNADPLLSY